MGKNKSLHKTKNVFKVATVRSIKLKAKAQKMMTNLKKLDLKANKMSNKDKTAHVDQQLKEWHKEVTQSKLKNKLQQKKTQDIVKKQRPQEAKKSTVRNITPAQAEATTCLVQQMQI